MRRTLIGWALLELAGLLAWGAEPAWRGAQAFLQELDRASQTNAPTKPPGAESSSLLQHDLAAFLQQRDALPPDDAARNWLLLGARLTKSLDPARPYEWLELRGRGRPAQPTLADLLTALPPTNAWPLLARQLASLPAAARRDVEPLRLLVLILAGETGDARQAVHAAAQALRGPMREYAAQGSAEMLQALQMLDDARQHTDGLTAFRWRLEAAEKLPAKQMVRLEVPDLAGMAGAAEAEKLLARLLLLPNANLSWSGGGETLKLAQHVALREIKALKQPPWSLVQGPDCLALYQALAGKFPDRSRTRTEALPAPGLVMLDMERDDSRDSYERRSARAWYLAALLEQERTAEAEQLLLTNQDDARGEAYAFTDHLRRLNDPAQARRMYEFLAGLAQKNPDLGLWPAAGALVAPAGVEADWIARLQAVLGTPALKPKARLAVREALNRALLAADRVDDAAGLLRQALAETSASEPGAAGRKPRDQRIETALLLAKLGRLLNRDDWTREGLTAAQAAAGDRMDTGYGLQSVTRALLEQKRYAGAESFVFAALRQAAAANQPENRSRRAYELRDLAGQLLDVYAAAGRPADVLALLERMPYWEARDLIELSPRGVGEENAWRAAAVALHAAGRTAEAVPILKTMLAQQPGEDAGYQALLDMAGGAELLPWLDQLYARDRFEERPLIWKAVLLQKLGRLDEAEQTARLALKVDPTDGETRAGDRVRGYAVLGDILAARGRQEDATFFRHVVQSVRIAEQGDELAEVGLVKRSLELYEKAQALFADAYCVQWRLAERLWALGQKEEAEKHYAIAFERMPEQFGRVASLCFGCEGVFTKPQSRSVAERVLLRLEQTNPQRPQLFFLLGQLRAAQERPGAALAYYRRAAALDPDYLDAWKQIAELADAAGLAPAERSALALHMLQMDPLCRHHSSSFEHITDLPTLWETVRAQQSLALPWPERLLELRASRERLARREEGGESRSAYDGDDERLRTPGQALLQQGLIRSALQWMQMTAVANAAQEE